MSLVGAHQPPLPRPSHSPGCVSN